MTIIPPLTGLIPSQTDLSAPPYTGPVTFVLLDTGLISTCSCTSRQSACYTLLYVTAGHCRLYLDGDTWQPLAPGSCFILAPGADFRLQEEPGQPLLGYELTFAAACFPAHTALPEPASEPDGKLPYTGLLGSCSSPAIADAIRLLYQSRGDKEPLRQLGRQAQFLELLGRIWQQAETAAPKEEPAESSGRIERTIHYMKQAYNQELTRDQLADMAGMSPSYYSSAFRKQTGRSPMDMLAEIRIEQARKLLLVSDSPLRSIAQAVGFSSEFYFSSRFKQVTGLAPSVYVKRSHSRKVASSQLYTSHLKPAQRPATEEERSNQKPERIVGLFMEDYLLVLGIKPLAQFVLEGYSQRYLEPYLEGAVKLDISRMDYSWLRRASPDMIVLGFSHFAADGRYDQFAGIAPTYIFQQPDINWRENLLSLGHLVGREEQAEQAIARYDKKARQARAYLARAIGRQTVALLRFHFKEGLCLYGGPGGYTAPVLYEDLGLQMPPLLKDWSRQGVPPVTPIGPETLQQLDADHLFVVVDREQQEQARRLLGSTLWSELSAVRNGHVYHVDTDIWMTFGMLAHERKMTDVLQALVPSCSLDEEGSSFSGTA